MISNQAKIVHLTSAHTRYDTRIFLKECRALAAAGYYISLVVADGLGDEQKDNVFIYDVGSSKNRIDRMTRICRRVYNKAIELEANIYHIHDPELIPYGLRLKSADKIIIFDAHEDLPKQIIGKAYLNKLTRGVLSRIIGIYERRVCNHFDAIVSATPSINEKFLRINPKSVNINNYPLLGELSSDEFDWSKKMEHICYIGGISAIRGITFIVHAMSFVTSGARLKLVGPFSNENLAKEVRRMNGWSNVDELGFLDRKEVASVLSTSIAGLVTFLPLPNHIDAQPNKMFEYMSAGIPVIASDFPLWREIIEENKCGICVDPAKPNEIANAIDYIVSHPNEAEKMGRNGKNVVIEKYNWAIEEKKLLSLYQTFE
jgi:glycosyltransferase involved in cell wall biosynthesis